MAAAAAAAAAARVKSRSLQIFEEEPRAIDGSGRLWMLSHKPAKGLQIMLRGLERRLDLDYTLTGRTIEFPAEVYPVLPSDTLLARYWA